MSKVRTLEDLSNRLNDDLTWRKRELSKLKAMIETERSDMERSRVLLRSGLTLLYAHWEGFIKEAGSLYLEYVAMQRLNYDQLTSNFLALAFKKRLAEVNETHKATIYTTSLDFIRFQLSQRSQIPYKEGIRTGSNLSSEVLKEIICILGLEYDFYETKQKLIDTKLLAKRNQIAHGEYLDLDVEDYAALQKQIITMIDHFKAQIENNASQEKYKSP